MKTMTKMTPHLNRNILVVFSLLQLVALTAAAECKYCDKDCQDLLQHGKMFEHIECNRNKDACCKRLQKGQNATEERRPRNEFEEFHKNMMEDMKDFGESHKKAEKQNEESEDHFDEKIAKMDRDFEEGKQRNERSFEEESKKMDKEFETYMIIFGVFAGVICCLGIVASVYRYNMMARRGGGGMGGYVRGAQVYPGGQGQYPGALVSPAAQTYPGGGGQDYTQPLTSPHYHHV